MTSLLTILAPLLIGSLLIVTYNQYKAIKRLKLSAQLAQSKFQLLKAVQTELSFE